MSNNNSLRQSIGIVGGVGPYAGLFLQQAVLSHVRARRDQDYPPIVTISAPHAISDRTEFILGRTRVNPAYEIINQIRTLYAVGSRYIGIPCNSAHAEVILSVIQSGIADLPGLVLINLIDETFKTIAKKSSLAGIGVLATKGGYRSKLFEQYGERYSCEVRVPDSKAMQDSVHESIYDKVYGIKVLGYLHEKARRKLDSVFDFYRGCGVRTVILGCTELSVAFYNEDQHGSIALINPLKVMARELVLLHAEGQAVSGDSHP